MLLLRTMPVVLVLTITEAMPPTYKKTENGDEKSPKYEYQYDIMSDKGVGQGKTEVGDGILASGRYYVEGKNSSQSVEYVADDWGYHPYVEFQNTGPYSQTVTHIALDKEAMKMLNKKSNKEEAQTQNNKAVQSPQPNYIPLQNNEEQEPENQEKHVPAQEYNPPNNDYLYVDQDPKFVYVQNQQSDIKNTVFLQPVLYDEAPLEYENQKEQPISFYENPISNYYKPEKLTYFEPFLQYGHPAGYGTKIQNPNYIRPQNTRYLNRFKDLVSGQYVLDINTSVNTRLNGDNQGILVQPTPIVSEYTPVNTETQQTESTTATTTTSTTSTPAPTSTSDDMENEPLSKQPIIVTDGECETSSDEPTVIVTPKPVLATLKLQPTKTTHHGYVIDVQKSIPFYLGKIEYYDNAQIKDKNVTATATQHIRLGDLLQQPIVEKPKAQPLTSKFSQNSKTEINKDDSLQQLDNKYVAQDTKIVESVQKSHTGFVNKKKMAEAPLPQYVETPVSVQNVADVVHKPYSIAVPIPLTQTYYLPIEVPKPYPVELTKLVIPTAYSIQAAQQNVVEPIKVTRLSPINKNAKRLKNQELGSENYVYTRNLQLHNKTPCIDLRLFGVRKPYCPKINNNHYIGLVPPKIQTSFNYTSTNNSPRKQRTAREGLLDNVKWEYGFMPPLIPSLAIDENGNPVDKHSK